ncbi:MAG: YcaO-like family protein, partial [Thermodesulfobacteriota bacterium]|nr:YcaO-like family protein [Thermodesulfobacteriota bacterium]
MTLKISDAFKLAGSDHDKTVSPEKTIETFKTKCKSAGLSILDKTQRIDNNRLGIPVYFSICGHDAEKITGTKKQMGKGATPALAEASAVMELAERFSIYSFMENQDNFIYETYDNVKQDAIPFELIAKSVNDESNEEIKVLEKIFSTVKFKWTKAYNISQNKEMLIPMDWFFMINEFNGSSAGNCNEEAVCQGACEIVERHVSALISRKKKELIFIDHKSVTNPSTADLINKFTRAGIKLYINDFSLDTGICTIGILAFDPSTFPHTSEIVWTAGTAPEPDKALSRALTETAQLAGDFNTASNYMASGLPKFKSLKEAAFIIDPPNSKTVENKTPESKTPENKTPENKTLKSKKCKTVKLSDLPNISHMNIKDEISEITKALKQSGQELLTVNTTDNRLGVPAFYTIIPGANFRERAENSSIAMFLSKHIFENNPARKALTQLDKIDEKLPDRYYIKFYQGMCRLSMSKPDKALKYFESAMELDPANQDIPSISSYTGVCLKELGQYKKAILILETGIKADKEREDIYNLMGFCNFMLKQHEKSISCFEKVLELNPGSAIDHASIASNHRELGHKKQAIKYY